MTYANYTNTPSPEMPTLLGRVSSSASSSLAALAALVTKATSSVFPSPKNFIENPSISNVNVKTPINDTLTSIGDIRFETDNYNEWVEEDIVFQLPPRKTFSLELEIESVQKAKPNIVIPDWLIDESDV